MSLAQSVQTDLVGPDEKRQILEAAVRVPSGDNCQPFRFRWDGDTLNVFVDQKAAEHYLNIENLGTLVSLGCLAEIIAIQSTVVGCTSSFSFQNVAGDGPVMSAALEPGTVTVDELAPQIYHRYTDRRVYKGSTLEPSFFESSYEDVTVRVVRPDKVGLINAICKLDQVIWQTKSAQQDLMQWLRLSSGEKDCLDGMPWRTLGIGQVERVFLLLCRKWWVQRLLNSLGGTMMSRQVLKRQLLSSGYICLVSAKSPAQQAVINAGRTSYNLWLRLTDQQHGLQPLSLASFTAFAKERGELPPMSDKHIQLVVNTSDEIKSAFELPIDETPVWMFRTGEVDHAPDCLKAPRRPVEELLWK